MPDRQTKKQLGLSALKIQKNINEINLLQISFQQDVLLRNERKIGGGLKHQHSKSNTSNNNEYRKQKVYARP